MLLDNYDNIFCKFNSCCGLFSGEAEISESESEINDSKVVKKEDKDN